MKVISLSLYGSQDKYLRGAIENMRLAKFYYPDWQCRVYAGEDVPAFVTAELSSLGAQVIPMRERSLRGWLPGLFWRFYAVADPSAEAIIIRDADSRFSDREATAVADWLGSGKAFHVMRDHPAHTAPMLAGMWGCRGRALADIQRLRRGWQIRQLLVGEGIRGRWRHASPDQRFLQDEIYPRLGQDDALIHSEFVRYEGEEVVPFPTERKGSEFVGEIWDAENRWIPEHRELVRHARMTTYPTPIRRSVANVLRSKVARRRGAMR